MISWTSLGTADYEALAFAAVKHFEGFEAEAYRDSVGIPTIGYGFNLRVDSVRERILAEFGLTPATQDFDDLDSLIEAVADQVWASDTALRSALDGALADYNLTHNPVRASFDVTEAEADSIFSALHEGYETGLNNQIGGVADSYERVALLSLQYNNPILIGPGLEGAVAAGDRAEAWYEIRYNSNGGTSESSGIAKRRFIESHFFTLYGETNPDGDFRPSETDALNAFRMLTKHEQRISSYETTYAAQVANANADLTVIETAAGVGDIGAVSGFNQSFESARRTLLENYADLSQIAPEMISWLNAAGYEGHLKALDPVGLKTAAAIGDEAALASTLTTASLRHVWVAANTSAGGGEVSARTVNRSEAAAANDLIFGSINQQGESADQVDTLSGGAGSDVFIGGLGADIMNGGADEDTVSYLAGTAGVTVNLGDQAAEQGGYAEGDVLSNIENVLGTDFVDRLTGNAQSNVLYGGGENDTLTGGAGADFLFGGDGFDTADYAAEAGGGVVSVTQAGQLTENDETIYLVTDSHGTTDTLISIERIVGASGTENFDIETGLIFNGGGGNDYYFGPGGQQATWGTIEFAAGGGHDVIYFEGDFNNLPSGFITISLETVSAADVSMIWDPEEIASEWWYLEGHPDPYFSAHYVGNIGIQLSGGATIAIGMVSAEFSTFQLEQQTEQSEPDPTGWHTVSFGSAVVGVTLAEGYFSFEDLLTLLNYSDPDDLGVAASGVLDQPGGSSRMSMQAGSSEAVKADQIAMPPQPPPAADSAAAQDTFFLSPGIDMFDFRHIQETKPAYDERQWHSDLTAAVSDATAPFSFGAVGEYEPLQPREFGAEDPGSGLRQYDLEFTWLA